MPRGLCAEPTCAAEPVYRGRCQRHARARDRSINRAGRGIYQTARWKYTRRAYLHKHPMCERCTSALATEVHHRRDLAEGGAPYAMANLEALCRQCHSRETRARQIGATT